MKGIIAARRLLEKLGSPEPPIQLSKVCEILSINLRFEDLGSLDAYFMLTQDSALIVVNDARPIVRQRFSGAHELGHLSLGHGPAGFVGGLLLENKNEKWQEVHANHFASELLMPKRSLIRWRVGLTPSKLGQICRVSEEAARIRMEQLGWR